jgi:hypothetical protein
MRKLLPLLVAAAAPVAAQQSSAPPVRLINAPEASSKPVLGNAVAARQLPNGNVVVNDITKRQLVMFDPTLGTTTIIADSVSGGANSYGPSAGALTGFFGDSLLFIDPRDLSMFIIDPKGAIARVAAVPRSQDAMAMGSNVLGAPALDSKGRLVYRAGPGVRMMAPAGGGRGGSGAGPGGMPMPDFPDSTAIMRVDLATRKVDTVAFFKIPKTKMNITQTDGRVSMTNEINPMPIVDDFAVISDGSVAIVRGQDYHVDWVSPEGGMAPTAKIPFDWQRLTDEDKIAVIDSSKSAMERQRAAAAANPSVATEGAQRMVMSFSMSGDGAARGTTMAAGALPPLAFINAAELPDYRPAFRQGAARADLDGNLWVRTSAVRTGGVTGTIYDVVNRKGELVDRLQIPAGRQIIGFGRGGVVYMSASDEKGTWIERAKARESVRP